jgi:hypothetical protein
MFTSGRHMLLAAAAAVLLLLVAPPPTAAAKHPGKVVGGPGGRARIEDLPYIRCQASTFQGLTVLCTSRAAPSAAASQPAPCPPPANTACTQLPALVTQSNASNLPDFLACPQVCELLARNAWQQVAEMKQAATLADPVSLPILAVGLQRTGTSLWPTANARRCCQMIC